MEDDPSLKKVHPRLRDLWDLKGAIIELLIVMALFFSSLSPTSDFSALIGLSIAVTVFAVFLMIFDVREMIKKRDFRKPLIVLLVLDGVVLLASCVVLNQWIVVSNDSTDDDSSRYSVLYGLDALMMIAMMLIVSSRLYIRAKDRQREEENAEGIYMRNNGNNPPPPSTNRVEMII